MYFKIQFLSTKDNAEEFMMISISNCLFQNEELCMYQDINHGAAMAVNAGDGQYQLVN